ncbi:MAG: hypothetical protein K1X50_16575 [Candidatus Promineofilum sp.]|nr:hypothetical protein [Promineifilum sp.]MCW5863285.1 hypothetical protein [Anaerolineae bacterium]
MKPKLIVFVVALLIVAMVPALAMAKGQAKPEQMGRVRIDARQPIGPQLDAQLGVGARGPRSATMVVRDNRVSVRPNAVYALLNDGFEDGVGNWGFFENGISPVGWDATDYMAKRGQYSLYSAGYNNDPFVNPYYDNDMESWAYTTMDLQGARRAQVRFQFKSDTEFFWDAFFFCGSADGGFTFDCYYHTGSTNDKWRLVQLDSRTDPVLAGMLDSPDAIFAFVFVSDFSIVDRGTFVDALRIRVWGPSPIN